MAPAAPATRVVVQIGRDRVAVAADDGIPASGESSLGWSQSRSRGSGSARRRGPSSRPVVGAGLAEGLVVVLVARVTHEN